MRRYLIALTCVALIGAACGGDGPDPSEDPKAALRSAIQNLSDYEGTDVTLRVQSDRDSLVAISEGELQSDDADTILESSINMRSRGGDNPEDAQLEMTVDIGGDLVELKVVDEIAYLRADVRDLVEHFGGNQRELDQFVQEAGAQPQLDYVGPVVEGEWLAMEGARELQEQLGVPTPDAQLQEQLANDLEQAIDGHSTVTSEGDDDIGHHVVANVRVRPLYGSIADSLGEFVLPNIPGAGLPDAEQIPDEEVRVDVWIANDRIRQILLDMTQFSDWGDADIPEGVERFALQLDLEEFNDEVQAPDAAATADLQEILQGFFGGMMPGGMGGEMGGEESVPAGPGDLEELCRELEQAPPEVQEQFAGECPNL